MLKPETAERWNWEEGWVRIERTVHREDCLSFVSRFPGFCRCPRSSIWVHNTITTNGRNLLRDYFVGGIITYVAVGSSNTAPAVGDTKLGAEFFRKPVTSRLAYGTGDALTTVYLSPYDANSPKIEEIGWFGGAATLEKDTGTLLARVLYSHQKTDQESIQIGRHDTV